MARMINWQKPDALKNALPNGVSIEAFAELSSVSKAQLYRLNAGGGNPRWETDRKIRAALDKLQDSASRKYATKQPGSKAAQKAYAQRDSAA